MTAPVSGSQGLIQTILTIKQLQSQEEAQRLAREQLGLSRSEFELRQASTGAQLLGSLGQLASALPDAKKLLPHVASIAKRTGLDEATLNTIFSEAVPASDVTKAGVLQRGVAKAGGALEEPTAFANLAGVQPGQLELDDMNKLIFQGAHQWLSNLPDDKKKVFNARVATKLGSGMNLGDALNEEIMMNAPAEIQQQAAMIGARLAPSADAIVQGRLGAGNLALQTRLGEIDGAYKQAQVNVAMEEAKARFKAQPDKLQAATEVIKAISDLQQFQIKNSATLTPEGQEQQNATLNGLIDRLNQIDPELGKNFMKIDLKQPLAATGPLDAIRQSMRKP